MGNPHNASTEQCATRLSLADLVTMPSMALKVLCVEAFPSSIALTRYEEQEDKDKEGSVQWGCGDVLLELRFENSTCYMDEICLSS